MKEINMRADPVKIAATKWEINTDATQIRHRRHVETVCSIIMTIIPSIPWSCMVVGSIFFPVELTDLVKFLVSYDTAEVKVVATVVVTVVDVTKDVRSVSEISQTVSEVALPFLRTAFPLQLEKLKGRSQVSELWTLICRRISPSLTLYEACRGQCRRQCQRMSHQYRVHTSH